MTGASLPAYWRCLAASPAFRRLWMADLVNSCGWWLNYVASMAVVGSTEQGSGLAVSAVLLVNLLPSLLLSPACGVVADRCNRITVIVTTCLLGAVLAAGLALAASLPQPNTRLLLALLTLHYSASAFYDTARTAAIPALVPASHLHLANTLDTLSWSLSGVAGGAVAGLLASKLGNPACFLLDGFTFLIAACCMHQLPRSVGLPAGPPPCPIALATPLQLKKKHSDYLLAVELVEGGEGGAHGDALRLPSAGAHQPRPERQRGAGGSECRMQSEAAGERGEAAGREGAAEAEGAADRQHAAGTGEAEPLLEYVVPAAEEQAVGVREEEECSSEGKLGKAEEDLVAEEGAGLSAEAGELAGPQTPCAQPHPPFLPAALHTGSNTAPLLGAVKGGLSAAWEGWRFVAARENRDVAVLVSIKAWGALLWGGTDVFNVRLSELPSMQQWGDASVTLGLILAALSLGCMAGPLLLNTVVAPRPAALAWGVAAAFGIILLGFLLTLLAGSIGPLLLATFVRELGTDSLCVFSTLLLQLRVPNSVLGRMTALETALQTVTQAASSLFAGAATDVLHLTTHQALAGMSVAAGVVAAMWAAFAGTGARCGLHQ